MREKFYVCCASETDVVVSVLWQTSRSSGAWTHQVRASVRGRVSDAQDDEEECGRCGSRWRRKLRGQATARAVDSHEAARNFGREIVCKEMICVRLQ